jgi:hypothetical protein
MPWVKKGKHHFLKNNIHVDNEKLYFAEGLKFLVWNKRSWKLLKYFIFN